MEIAQEVVTLVRHDDVRAVLTRPWTLPGSARSLLAAAIRDCPYATRIHDESRRQPHTAYTLAALAAHGCRVDVAPCASCDAVVNVRIYPDAASEAVFAAARAHLAAHYDPLAAHAFGALVAIYCRTGWFSARREPFEDPRRPEYTDATIALLRPLGYDLERLPRGFRMINDVCREPTVDPRAPPDEDWEWMY